MEEHIFTHKGPPFSVCHGLLFRLWAWRKVLFRSQKRLEREGAHMLSFDFLFSLCKYSLSLTLEHNKWANWEPPCLEMLSSCLLNSSRPYVHQVSWSLLQVWFYKECWSHFVYVHAGKKVFNTSILFPMYAHSTPADFKEDPCTCAQFGGLLENVPWLCSFTHAHKRKEAAVAEGWRQGWNVDGLDVL